MFDTVVTALAAMACLVTLFPMWYVFACSISDPGMVSAGKVTFLPKGFSVEAYRMVLANMDFWRSILNSCFYVIAGSALMLFNTIAVAYPLTRPNLKFRKPLTFYLLIQMYFGGMISESKEVLGNEAGAVQFAAGPDTAGVLQHLEHHTV